MITARQFRSGIAIEVNRVLHMILESQHIKPGKGGAFVRVKLKNFATGASFEQTFRPEDTFPQAYIEQKKMQHLYHDDSIHYFMDQSTYEQIGMDESAIGENAKFLKDGMEADVSFYKDKPIGITLPPFVELKITYTEPGIKGDTAKGGLKHATLETGATVRVPLFINTGDTIRLDTRTGDYSRRA